MLFFRKWYTDGWEIREKISTCTEKVGFSRSAGTSMYGILVKVTPPDLKSLIYCICAHIWVIGSMGSIPGAFDSICYESQVSASIIWLRSRWLQMFPKNSGLKVAWINCIRMEIVFCVPQQLLCGRTNFHMGQNSFYCEKVKYPAVLRIYHDILTNSHCTIACNIGHCLME